MGVVLSLMGVALCVLGLYFIFFAFLLCKFYIKHRLFLNVEFAFKYEMWEWLRPGKIPETQVLATLLTGNAWLFDGKKYTLHVRYQEVISEFPILEVCIAQV